MRSLVFMKCFDILSETEYICHYRKPSLFKLNTLEHVTIKTIIVPLFLESYKVLIKLCG